MIHENKIEFKNLIWRIAKITNFTASLIEKDYYLSIILLEINKLSQDLIFKGGTCLNKIYFPYHRISEDLDFNLLFRLPTKAEKKITGFSPRRESLKHIENNINSFMKQFGLMPTRELKKQDNSRQYNFEFGYNSVITDKVETIKIELRSRDKSIVLPIEEHPVQHKFTDPFRNESLIDDGLVKTLSLKEVLADKLAAAINRAKPRDFYDIDYAIRNNFDFADKFFVEVFKKKLQDDNNETEISKYKDNLGLTSGAIDNIKYEIPLVLYPVLSIDEQRNFTIASALKRINIAMQQMIEIER